MIQTILLFTISLGMLIGLGIPIILLCIYFIIAGKNWRNIEFVRPRQSQWLFKVTTPKDPQQPGLLRQGYFFSQNENGVYVADPHTYDKVEYRDVKNGSWWFHFRVWLMLQGSPVVDIIWPWQQILPIHMIRGKYFASPINEKKEEGHKKDEGGETAGVDEPNGIRTVHPLSPNVHIINEVNYSLLDRAQYTFVFENIELVATTKDKVGDEITEVDEKVFALFVVRVFVEVTNGRRATLDCQPVGSFIDRMSGLLLEVVRAYGYGTTYEDGVAEKTSSSAHDEVMKHKDGVERQTLYARIMEISETLEAQIGHKIVDFDFLEFDIMGSKAVKEALQSNVIAKLNGKALLTTETFKKEAKIKEGEGEKAFMDLVTEALTKRVTDVHGEVIRNNSQELYKYEQIRESKLVNYSDSGPSNATMLLNYPLQTPPTPTSTPAKTKEDGKEEQAK